MWFAAGGRRRAGRVLAPAAGQPCSAALADPLAQRRWRRHEQALQLIEQPRALRNAGPVGTSSTPKALRLPLARGVETPSPASTRRAGSRLCRSGLGRREPGGRFGAPHIEAERRVAVGHQPGVRSDAQRPTIEPDRQVENAPGIAAGEEQRNTGEQDQHVDQPDTRSRPAEARPAPEPRKKATITYCGIANSHHFTSANPRDSRSGYATSSLAG